MTLLWTLFVSLLVLLSQPGFAAEEKRTDFLNHAAAVIAGDGVLIASNSNAFPYSVRIVGGEKSKLSFEAGQILVGTTDFLFRNTVVWIKDLAMKERGDDRKVLGAHAAWESKDLNVLTGQKLSAKPNFVNVNGRTWAHWTYDLSASLHSSKNQKAGNPPAAGLVRQHYLTTVVGKYIVVLVTDSRSGSGEQATQAALLRVAGTFVVYPEALSPEQMSALAKQKQP